ncbi:MAG: hypothetical protein JNK47_12080 [Mesorhizobium sp.]|nr:hypothetical protein [Mesorhizobium sp.]MBL8577958.1 hypothetical protein [Mesorhizobium sp.]
MRNFDFTSWQAVLTSVLGLLLFTLVGMGIRLLMMMTIQARRERQNRQINERLKVLIAAYKTLGGSFTGTLSVNPAHMRDLCAAPPEAAEDATGEPSGSGATPSERARRIRDAVEAALSDIVLFGTEEQVALAAAAMRDMAAGRPVLVHDLVISLRNHIRAVLDLQPIPAGVMIPNQGPARPSGAGGGRERGGDQAGRSGGGGAGMGGMGGGMAGGMAGGGLAGGVALGLDTDDRPDKG